MPKLTKELILHWIDNAQYSENSETLIYHPETKLYTDLTAIIEQAIEWHEDSKLTYSTPVQTDSESHVIIP